MVVRAERTGRAQAPVVLLSFPASNRDPLTSQLAGALSELVPLQYFSWKFALTGRYDVLNVHWPDHLTKQRGFAGTVARRALYAALLVRVRLGRAVLVRTLHNLAPHERRRGPEQWLLRLTDRWTDAYITMQPDSSPPGSAPATFIPQGHYRQLYDGVAGEQPVPGRLLFFGIIRAYKGVPDLIAAFRRLPDPDVGLRIVGRPFRPQDASAVQDGARQDPRVSCDLGWIEHPQLAAEIGRAELVVLPYLEMHNSGTVLVALSMDRPVLIPQNANAAALAAEVGPGWVHTYEPPLTAAALADALTGLRAAPPKGRPDLSRRGWDAIAAAYVTVFQSTIDRVRRRRP